MKLDAGLVYAFKGNGRYEFYSYNTTDNTWATLESIPAVGRAGKKKAVKKGSALTTVGGMVYGAKGNNTLEWWAYDPALRTWTQKADVPAGAKNLKEGTGAVAVSIDGTDYVYLLRGANSTDFHRYNVGTDVWESRAPAPVGASGKSFKNGSALAVDETGRTLFALKGSYNEFFSYSVDSDIWTSRAILPFIGSTGKKKKVKDGAGLAAFSGYVYAQKGGNTQEWWSYQADTDRWTQLADVPIGGGRRAKGGGAVVAGAEGLFALKGNNTLEFHRYIPLMEPLVKNAAQSGIQQAGAAPGSRLELRIAPNPFSHATTIRYSLTRPARVQLALYDVTGKLVTTLAAGYCQAGDHAVPVGHWDLVIGHSRPARGVYLLKLEAEGSTATRKLILE